MDNGVSYEFLWCGMQKRRDAGVGFLIKVDPNITIKEAEILDPRLIAINLKVYGFNTKVVNIYSPTEAGSDSLKDSFYRLLKKSLIKTEKHEKLIIAGDFNAKTSIAFEKCCFDGTNAIYDNDCNNNGERLKKLCISQKLCIASTFFDYQNENRYTWYSCDGKTKRINDYVLTEKYVQQYINDCIARPEIDFDSDHRILITSLCTPMTRKSRKTKIKLSKVSKPVDITSLKTDEFKNRFVEAVDDSLQETHVIDRSSEQIAETVTDILQVAARKVLPSRKVNGEADLWKDDKEFNKLLNERMIIPRNSDKYKDITKLIKKRITHLRNQKLREEANSINENSTRREIEELYRKMKDGNNSFKKLKDKQQCDSRKLTEYFKSHFNKEHPDTSINLEDAPKFLSDLQNMNEVQLNTNAPEEDEVRSIISSLKNGKSANDVPAIFVKCAIDSKKFMNEIMELFQTIWKTNKIPKSWGHSKLVALWKGSAKGSQTNPESYRGLQIGSTLCKILVILVINRMKDWYEKQLLDQQQGFRSGRGTTDGIYIIKRIQQISDKMKKPIYALFVDLKAAFDNVDRKLMFETIRKRFPPSAKNNKLIEILESLYSHTTSALSQTPDEKFQLNNGVRQGGPESPVLFNLLLDFTMRVYLCECKNIGIKFLQLNYRIPESAALTSRTKIGHHHVDWVGYADDIVLAFEDKVNLQLGTSLLHQVFQKFHLEINTTKTKTMILNQRYTRGYINEKCPNSIISLSGIPIENVEEFKYLGSIINDNEPSTGNSELQIRIDSAWCKFYELSKNFTNHKIELKTRVNIMNSLVRSRLTCACQTWTLTAIQMNQISAVYVSILRKMVKGGYRRKSGQYAFELTNEDIIKRCSTESIHQYVNRLQRNFVAHVIRGKDTKLTKRLLFNDDKRRKPGYQMTLYKSVTKNENTTPDDLNKKALERKF